MSKCFKAPSNSSFSAFCHSSYNLALIHFVVSSLSSSVNWLTNHVHFRRCSPVLSLCHSFTCWFTWMIDESSAVFASENVPNCDDTPINLKICPDQIQTGLDDLDLLRLYRRKHCLHGRQFKIASFVRLFWLLRPLSRVSVWRINSQFVELLNFWFSNFLED